jgi:hypothetical protein
MSGAGLRRFVAGSSSAGGLPAAAASAVAEGAAQSRLAPTGAPADQPEGQPAPEEHCEFCAAVIPPDHSHVADLEGAALMCACRACYLLFTHPGAGMGRQAGPGHGRYQAVPDRYLTDPARPLSLAEWDSLQIPVGLAFFLRTSRGGGTTAFYPSPAGVTECQLNLDAWALIAADHPLLAAAAPDVEAILISRGPLGEPGQPSADSAPGQADAGGNRGAGSAPGQADAAGQPRAGPGTGAAASPHQHGAEAFLVPVDACYELAGRMRLLWRGFDGGAEARQSMAEFLERLRQRSRNLSREP